MRVLLATTFGRIQLAIGGVAVTLCVLNIAVFRGVDDPSLAISVASNLVWPLITVVLLFGMLARDELIFRDWIAFAAAMLTSSTLAAANIALDRHHGSAEFLLDATGWFLGVTLLCLIWSWMGRTRQQR